MLQTLIQFESPKSWLIHNPAPHIAIQLKRCLPKIDSRQHGTLTLSATYENSRDLEWFLQRYPMPVDRPDILSELANKHREKETLVSKLLRGKYDSNVVHNLKIQPREYQISAAQLWMAVNGLLIGDEVGLGKSLIFILGLVEPGRLPGLIVTMTHLTAQWKEEIEKFTDLSVHIIKKGQPYDITKSNKGKFPDVVVINYHKLSGWADTFQGMFKLVGFDEVSELRHSGTGKYTAAKHIADSAEWVGANSATAIYGYGGEIYNIMNVIKSDCLGTYDEFSREWCTYINGKLALKDSAAFGEYLREAGLMIRRTRSEVKRELPPLTIIPHTIQADESKFMDLVGGGSAVELAKLVLRHNEDFKGQKMSAAGQFDIKMRQSTGISKAPYIIEFVKFLHEESQEKLLLYIWHHAVKDLLVEGLKHLKPVVFTGEESATEKEAAKKAFIEGDSQVMIMNLRAGLGTNGLQDVCKICIFCEPDYSPSIMYYQGPGRLRRDGQDETVVAYYLMSESGSDPVIYDILGIKRQQLTGLNDPNQALVTQAQVNPNYVKMLAEDFLKKQGIVVEGNTNEINV